MKTKILFAFAASVFTLLPANPARAAAPDTNPPPQLTVELRDGSRVVGTSVENNFKFHSALLGDLKLRVDNIRLIERASTNSVKLKAANGDIFMLQFADTSLALKTSFGKVGLAIDSIRKLSVAAASMSAPQHEGLVGFWSGNGDANDSTGGSNGTLMGGANFAPGLAGQAFNFSEPGSFVKISSASALDPGSQVSIEFWMKPDAANAMSTYQGLVTSDFYGVEISNGYGGNMGVNFFLGSAMNSPGGWKGRIESNFNGLSSRGNYTFAHTSDANGGGVPVSAGQWHHIAATYDGAQLRLYVDGQISGRPASRRPTMMPAGASYPGTSDATAIPPMLPASFLAIGSEDGRTASPDCIGNRYFKGQIGGVALYKRALTPAEIREDYETQKPE
jgi:hypothetical protein